MAYRHGLFGEGLGEILVDGRRGQPERGAVLVGVGVGDLAHAGHPHRGHAHGAWMAAGIDGAAAQVGRAELAAGGAQGRQLGMGGGVVGGMDFVDAGGDHRAIAHHDRAERAAALVDIGARQRDGLPQVMVFVRHGGVSGWLHAFGGPGRSAVPGRARNAPI
ncbi:hypothetical protein D3C78_1196030 [compost metagenome]